jgi:hypothetical protein
VSSTGVDLPLNMHTQLCIELMTVADPSHHADEGSSGESMELATLPLIY